MDLDRRWFLGGAVGFAFTSAAAAKGEEAHRFGTADAAIEFHDGYASRGFWFGEQMSNRRYFLSAGGEAICSHFSGIRTRELECPSNRTRRSSA